MSTKVALQGNRQGICCNNILEGLRIESQCNKKFARSDTTFGGKIIYTSSYGLISTIVPFGANLAISSISSSVTAIHPFVQSTSV